MGFFHSFLWFSTGYPAFFHNLAVGSAACLGASAKRDPAANLAERLISICGKP